MECIYVDIHTLRKIDIPDSYFVVHRSWDWSTGRDLSQYVQADGQVVNVRCVRKPTNGTLIIFTRTLRYARGSSCITLLLGLVGVLALQIALAVIPREPYGRA